MFQKPALASAGTGAVPALGGGTWNRVSSIGLSLAVAVIPKCSVCLMVHGSVLAAIGLGTLPELPRPVLVASLLGAVGLLARGARARRGYGPAAMASVAALLLMVTELAHSHGSAAAHAAGAGPHHPLFTRAAGALLVLASVWNAWPVSRRNASTAACVPCRAPASEPAG